MKDNIPVISLVLFAISIGTTVGLVVIAPTTMIPATAFLFITIALTLSVMFLGVYTLSMMAYIMDALEVLNEDNGDPRACGWCDVPHACEPGLRDSEKHH